jgi:catechol 2,3-dioxygenase-like lactoylglutathione lyase family enzyme
MKRMHIHVGVDHLDQSIKFYSALFGAEPSKTKADYAKWMLDDPRINFAISTRAGKGVDHLGLQVDADSELAALREQFKRAEMTAFDEGETVCCYAQSDKSWLEDPSGVAWEIFQTMEDAQLYSKQSPVAEQACCIPDSRLQAACCDG